ncbi:MAG TPA: tetratricopeptide repeat protein [Rhizomicrobium sp.]|nr:tetratricopeptide repeat protein [Rhizomicrobium sp.]
MKIRRALGISIPLVFCVGLGVAAQEGQKNAPSVTVRLLTTDFQVAADGSNTQTIHTEVLAGNDAGALRLSQTSISYDSAAQEISVIDAHTLKADGKTLPVDGTAIYDQPPPGLDPSMVTSLRAKLIVFPQFTAGDIAVYTVQIKTKRPNFENQFFYGDVFPRTGAYEDVRETVTAPKTFPLYVESHDVDFRQRDDGANVTYSWHYSAPKPIAEEPVTLSPLDHTPRFFASSFKDYAQLGRAYAALTEPRRVVTPKIRALADEVTAGTSDQKAQAQKLYEWVISHIRYVAIELGTGSFVPHDVDAIIANGYGDCKDHDILLQTLLKAKGIEAESILVNGSGLYAMTSVPTFTILDHVITFVPQFNLYLDSSIAVAPFGILPMQEYGKSMVVASAASPGLGKMPLLQPGVAKVTVKTVSILDKDGTLSGTTTTTASGPYAITLRQVGLGIQAVGPTAATRVLESLGYTQPSGSFIQESPKSFTPEYTISSTFKTLGWEDNLAGKSRFSMPGGLRLFALTGDNVMGPFDPGNMKPGEPTACFSASQSEDLSLKAPPGHQFLGLPNNVRVETPNILFTAQWSLVGDTLSVHRDFSSKIDQPLCSGIVRTQSAAALKEISDSYNVSIAFAKRDRDGGDAVANAALPFFNNGFSHLNAGRYELAIADFDKAIALKPDDFYSYDARGDAYAKLGQYVQAIENFDQAIKLKKDLPATYSSRGFAHEALGQHDLAIADFSRAIALKPDDARFYGGRAEAYRVSGQQAASLADFEKVIALDPNGPAAASAFYFHGLAQAESRPELAIADLDKSIALKPDAAISYQVRGTAKAYLRQYPGALADFDKALALKPDDIDTLSNRGGVNFAAKNYKQAIADYDRVIAQKPDSSWALFYRGGAKNKLGQKKEGEADIAAAIKLNPSLGK